MIYNKHDAIESLRPNGQYTWCGFNYSDLIWHDSDTHQLFLYTGSEWRLTGPVYTNAQTLSGWQIETLTDAGANNYVVSTIMAANVRVAIASGSAEFTPSPAVSGFTTIKPGLNLNSNNYFCYEI